MKPKLLITQFKLDLATSDYEALCDQVAQAIADVPGMRWKIWTHNATAGEAGGVYLFDSEAAVTQFLEGPIIAAVGQNPAFREIIFKALDILPGPTAVTNGPIK